jgi:hypothetical protein
MPDDRLESREMHQEIAELLASVAKALAISDSDCIAALESGDLSLALDQDENGNRYINATHGGRTVRVYKGAIRHSPD